VVVVQLCDRLCWDPPSPTSSQTPPGRGGFRSCWGRPFPAMGRRRCGLWPGRGSLARDRGTESSKTTGGCRGLKSGPHASTEEKMHPNRPKKPAEGRTLSPGSIPTQIPHGQQELQFRTPPPGVAPSAHLRARTRRRPAAGPGLPPALSARSPPPLPSRGRFLSTAQRLSGVGGGDCSARTVPGPPRAVPAWAGSPPTPGRAQRGRKLGCAGGSAGPGPAGRLPLPSPSLSPSPTLAAPARAPSPEAGSPGPPARRNSGRAALSWRGLRPAPRGPTPGGGREANGVGGAGKEGTRPLLCGWGRGHFAQGWGWGRGRLRGGAGLWGGAGLGGRSSWEGPCAPSAVTA
jgi:hypothetical protein